MIRILLIVSGILAVLIGAALLFSPAGFESPMGIVITDKVGVIAQAQGAILLGVGLLNLLMSRSKDRTALSAVLSGNLVIQLCSFGVVARAMLTGIFPPSAAGPMSIHLLLAVWFAVALAVNRR